MSEISLTAGLACYKPSRMSLPVGRSAADLRFGMTGDAWSEGLILVTTLGNLIPLGQVIQPHWSWFRNLDANNYVDLRNGLSGAVFLRLYPGEECPAPLCPSCVPCAFTNGGSAYLEYLVLSL